MRIVRVHHSIDCVAQGPQPCRKIRGENHDAGDADKEHEDTLSLTVRSSYTFNEAEEAQKIRDGQQRIA